MSLLSPSLTTENSYSSAETPSITANDLRFLDAKLSASSSSHDLSRAASIANLTAPALFGIYSPTITSPDPEDSDDRLTAADSLWEVGGAESPKGRFGLDDETYVVVRDRSTRGRQRISCDRVASRSVSTSSSNLSGASALSLTVRSLILFVLGVGYGTIVSQLPSKQNLTAFGVENVASAGTHGGYLAFWGVAGVVLGALLPWFDTVWERAFDKDERQPRRKSSTRPPSLESEWPLVVRAIGAFVGIVFAIRRLPWTSSVQVSLTLALVNPFLWYLIDRSKQGLLLSSLFGLVGSAILMGFNPDIMPTPATLLGVVRLPGNATLGGLGTFAEEALTYAAIRGPNVIETSMWMLSVLFCSCVCFGNIGRLLSPGKSGTAPGRWGRLR
jgi:hypothetical protein